MNIRDHVTYNLLDMARNLPRSPGVYLLKDHTGQVLYVGKSKNLRARVMTYFNASSLSKDKDVKTQVMVNKVSDFEIIITKSEFEALLLENSLIKDRTPRYNIHLKDGKSYPVIRLTNEEYPRVFRTRTMILDGSEYFGPFPKVGQIDTYLTLIDKLFPLRKRGVSFKYREQPCLNYHIGRCAAPCSGHIDSSTYRQRVSTVRKLLGGNSTTLLSELRGLMEKEAAAQHYEHAAAYRDQIEAITEVTESEQDVVDFSRDARDYIGHHQNDSCYTITLFQVRNGQLVGRDRFRFVDPSPPEEVLPSFLLQLYAGVQTRPQSIFLRLPPTTVDLLQHALNETLKVRESSVSVVGNRDACNSVVSDTDRAAELLLVSSNDGSSSMAKQHDRPRVVIKVPQRGRHERFLRMAENNALIEWQTSEQRRRNNDEQLKSLKHLRDVLRLDSIPHHIEAFDISHLQGRDTVASMVVLVDGVPEKESYRHFRLRTLDDRVDDFAAMREVVARRYTRVMNDNLPIPNLVLVDGGKGQLNAATQVLQALGLKQLPVVALAKRKEEIYILDASVPIILPRTSGALHILQIARDESHRFATTFNRKLRRKQLTLSLLEGVRGIGPVRSRRLMTTFSSVEAMLAEKPETISKKIGVNCEIVARLLAHLSLQYGREEVEVTVPPFHGSGF